MHFYQTNLDTLLQSLENNEESTVTRSITAAATPITFPPRKQSIESTSSKTSSVETYNNNSSSSLSVSEKNGNAISTTDNLASDLERSRADQQQQLFIIQQQQLDIDSQEHELVNLRNHLCSLQLKLDKAGIVMTQLEMDEANNTGMNFKDMRQQIWTLQQERGEIETQLSDALNHIRKLESELNATTANQASLEHQIDAYKAQCDVLTSQTADLQARLGQNSSLVHHKSYSDLLEQYKKLEHNFNTIVKQHSEDTALLVSFESELEKTKAEATLSINSSKEKIKRLEDEVCIKEEQKARIIREARSSFKSNFETPTNASIESNSSNILEKAALLQDFECEMSSLQIKHDQNVKKFTRRMATLEESLSDHVMQISELTARIGQLELDNEKLVTELSVKNGELVSNEAKLAELFVMIDTVTIEKANLSMKLEQLSKKSATGANIASNELQVSQGEIDKYAAEVIQLRSRLEEVESSLSLKQKEAATLENMLSNHHNQSINHSKILSDKYDGEIRDLKSLLKTTQANLAAVISSAKQSNDSLTIMKLPTHEDSSNSIKALETKVEDLSQSLKQKTDTVYDLQRQLDSSKDMLALQSLDLEHTKTELKRSNEMVKQEQSKLCLLEGEKVKLVKKVHDLSTALAQQIEEKKEQNCSMADKIEGLENQLYSNQSCVEKLNEEIKSIRDQYQTQTEKNMAMDRSHKAQIADLETQLSVADAKLKKSIQLIDDIKTGGFIAEAEFEKSSLKQDVVSLYEERRALNNRIEELSGQLKAARMEIARLESAVNSASHVTTSSSQQSVMRRRIESLEDQLQSLLMKNIELVEASAVKDKQLNDLRKKV